MKSFKMKLSICLAITMLLLASCGKDEYEITQPTTTDTTPTTPTISTGNDYIGMDNAEEIALNHANLTLEETQNIDSYMDLSDESNIKYNIEFYVNDVKYEYQIQAKTGEVLDYSVNNTDDESTVNEQDDFIGELIAKYIALDHADVEEQDIDFINSKLGIRDDVTFYEIEFYIGNTEYDYEIDALTGEIIDFDNDAELFDVHVPEEIIVGEPIGEEEAVSIARDDAQVESTSNLFVKLETPEGENSYYWVEFLANNTQYGYEIHAVTGEVLFKSTETDENAVDGVIVDQNDEESPYIGDGKAVSTAVNHAGADPTSEISIELVFEGSKTMYNIDFSIDNTDYHYEIDAINGKIMVLNKDTKNYNTGMSTSSADTSVIGDEAALAIALKFVGADSASFIKVDFSYDNNIAVYNINFKIDNTWYDFEIDALTGKILAYS